MRQEGISSRERIEMILAWRGISAYALSQAIGLKRADTIYNITSGSYNISHRVAASLKETYPELNISWIYSGVGQMFAPDLNLEIPLYENSIDEIIFAEKPIEPAAVLQLPYLAKGDIAVRFKGDAMGSVTPKDTILVLREWSTERLLSRMECLVVESRRVHLREVELSEGALLLKAGDDSLYGDQRVALEKIDKIYRVMAKLTYML